MSKIETDKKNQLTKSARSSISGVVLSGGKGRRMQGVDKGLVTIADRPMIAWAVEALRPQVGIIMINANRNLKRYAELVKQIGPVQQVVSDELTDFQGPLAGMEAAMRQVETEYVVYAPCDSPFMPGDLVFKLYKKLTAENASIAVAFGAKRLQPVFCLLKTSLHQELQNYLQQGQRKIDYFFEHIGYVTVDFSSADAFININNEAERVSAAKKLRAMYR